jgi:hypothetical protein
MSVATASVLIAAASGVAASIFYSFQIRNQTRVPWQIRHLLGDRRAAHRLPRVGHAPDRCDRGKVGKALIPLAGIVMDLEEWDVSPDAEGIQLPDTFQRNRSEVWIWPGNQL